MDPKLIDFADQNPTGHFNLDVYLRAMLDDEDDVDQAPRHAIKALVAKATPEQLKALDILVMYAWSDGKIEGFDEGFDDARQDQLTKE